MFAGLFKRFFGEKGFSKIQTQDAVTVTIPGRTPFTMSSDHKLFPALVEALKNKNEEAVLGIVAMTEQVTHYTNGQVEVKHGQVFFKGEVISNIVADRILQFLAEGIPCDYLIKFLERVLQNPAKSAREELFLFLENGNLPIMTDGRFQAYKWVDRNLKDCHTRRIDNSVGRIIEMDRDACDPNRHNHCSTGFHVCTGNYSRFGDRLMIVAVDPADVVAVPTDYDFAKMRTCRYEVLEEVQGDAYNNYLEGKGLIQSSKVTAEDNPMVTHVDSSYSEPVVVKKPTKKSNKKVAKPKKTPKKVVTKPTKKGELKMDDQTWALFKKDVKNKRNNTVMSQRYGLSVEEMTPLKQKAKQELKNG